MQSMTLFTADAILCFGTLVAVITLLVLGHTNDDAKYHEIAKTLSVVFVGLSIPMAASAMTHRY